MADVTVLQPPLSPLAPLFIWKSLVLSSLGQIRALLTKKIGDLIISKESITGAKPF